jgi:hypothetical protein
VDPQASGQASSGPSGARRKLLATTFSRVEARDSMGNFDFSIPDRRAPRCQKKKGARSGRREKLFYFQNSNLAGAIVPRFQTLFLGCFVQLTKNQASQRA